MPPSTTRPSAHRLGLGSLVAAAALGIACAGEASDATTGVPDPAPTVHNAFGMPGPWWRAGASVERFDVEVKACRGESSAARERAGEADPLDAAYRAFLSCMEKHGWKRGRPPQPER